MLLWMKAMVDGMRSMIYTGAFWSDLSLEMPEGEKKEHYFSLIDFMTPIIKAYCSDAKIMSLYEGTNGIQSMDLLGRKMRINNGAPFTAFMNEIEGFCANNEDNPALGGQIRFLSKAVKRLSEIAKEMSYRAKSDPLQWASYTFNSPFGTNNLIEWQSHNFRIHKI